MNTTKIKISVACVLIDGFEQPFVEKRIWLSQRLVSYETGKYACPGGMVEDTDASDVHAMQRELLEETGINVTDLNRFKRSIVSYHNGGKSDVTQWFILQLSDELNETPIDTEPHKHSPWTFYTLPDAKNLPLMVSTGDVLETITMKKEIYLVTQGNYSDYGVRGVFTDKDLATEYAAQITTKYETARVDTQQIMTELIAPIGYRGYTVSMDIDGNTDEVESDKVGDLNVDNSYADMEFGLHGYITTGKYTFIINTDKGAEGAIKIANERRIRMIAENLWAKKGLTEKV